MAPQGDRTRRLDVCGIGDSLVDLTVEATEADLRSLGLTRGHTSHADSETLRRVRHWVKNRDPFRSSGGSGGNSVRTVAGLGGRAALMTRLGEDRWGDILAAEFAALGIETGDPVVPGGETGVCVSFVLPDAERSMVTDLGVCRGICGEDVREDWIREARWLLVEGYLVARPDLGARASLAAMEAAKRHGTHVAVGLSAPFVVRSHRPLLARIVDAADLVFANEEEARAYTGSAEAEESADRLATGRHGAVVTAGERGAFVRIGHETFHSPAVFCEEPRDTTGAGDCFAGAFLYGLSQGLEPARAARGASSIAAKVVSQAGASLPRDAREWWDQAVGSSRESPKD